MERPRLTGEAVVQGGRGGGGQGAVVLNPVLRLQGLGPRKTPVDQYISGGGGGVAFLELYIF